MSIRVAPAVRSALAEGRPVVALESTVITHGLPRPQNLELARELESLVREDGALAATVGVIAGELVVGLEEHELERLAAGDCDKASLWNLPALLAEKADAGTTVASTLLAADRAGIRVFATGGIGGVHPQPFDESADLLALARHGVVTVCSGPKSILLADATLERLETHGVPVVGFRSGRLAGFLVSETELPVPARLETPAAVAQAFRHQLQLGLPGGMLVSNPVSQGLDPQELSRYRRRAEREAAASGVSGKGLTPFLLARLADISQGRTVVVNLRLLRENAVLAARIAKALQAALLQDASLRSASLPPASLAPATLEPATLQSAALQADPQSAESQPVEPQPDERPTRTERMVVRDRGASHE